MEKIEPARVITFRFADPIRVGSPSALHQPRGHTTASDTCTTHSITACKAGAIHT